MTVLSLTFFVNSAKEIGTNYKCFVMVSESLTQGFEFWGCFVVFLIFLKIS